MKQIGKWTFAVITALFCSSALGVVSDAPSRQYQTISERNAFGLKPILPPQLTNEVLSPVLPKVFLTGITTILTNKLALLKVQTPAKPGEPAKDEPLMLAEGQRDAGVEVINIDTNAHTVRINNAGTFMTLTFDKDGVKTTATPATGVSPTGVGYSAVSNPIPTAPTTNLFPAPANGYAGQRPFPGRVLKIPSVANPPMPSNTTAAPPPSPAALGSQAASAPGPAAAGANPLSPEEEAILKELEAKNNPAPAAPR